MVAEPGMGSLTVTGPTGEWVGASSESGLVKTVSEKFRPLGSGVGQEIQRSIGEEALAPERLSQVVSGNQRSRRGAIDGLPKHCM